ncbi:PspA/IM30 family protein [Pseudoalteromonas sp. SCSIO 43201]|uniref:PspA/IM30 family protein n=1 Tax=Pseudoalteromonas TaxID=53246 RepID=UPI0020764525|nr:MULTISPECIES: PspA/IM30 family protein [Pseudoalteromonas]MDW7550436.1 PspA/IM30 family protein [Pseudoalteromonas peptidolytica]USD28234.1 PspA/IM30 family protein [Pseudoalteromonas sp. SCSIO 43201]
MTIINRIEDLIKAEFNALLDKAEDPQKLTSQLIRDLEEALADCRATAAEFICQQKIAQRQIEQANNASATWQSKAEHALEKGREDLARSALEQKQREIEKAQEAQQKVDDLAPALEKLSADADKLQSKIQQLKAKEKGMLRRLEAGQARLNIKQTLSSDEMRSATRKFDELERKVARIEAEVESYDLGQPDVWQRFEDEQKQQQIDDELAQLKQKIAS